MSSAAPGQQRSSGQGIGPGVRLEEQWSTSPALPDSGVPLFLGTLARLPSGLPLSLEARRGLEASPLVSFRQFLQRYGAQEHSLLGRSLRAYFANGGGPAYVCSALGPGAEGLEEALAEAAALEAVDLICAPGWTDLALQQRLLAYCAETGERSVLLDAPNMGLLSRAQALAEADAHAKVLSAHPAAAYGALYYPWLRWGAQDERGGPSSSALLADVLPPSGALAGLFARQDRAIGAHCAPANVRIEGAVDVTHVADGSLIDRTPVEIAPAWESGGSAARLNLLRPLRQRGVVVWGARTLSPNLEQAWIGTQRLLRMIVRHVRRLLEGLTFESNDLSAWMRVHRSLSSYLMQLFQRGALVGSTPEAAWFVKCDHENNPLSIRQQGQLVVELGVAPTRPLEFLVLRILHSEQQTVITGAA